MARRSRREAEAGEHEGRGAQPAETVATRREQYLVARRPGAPPAGAESVDLNAVRAALERDPEIRIKRTLTPTGLGSLAGGLPAQQAIIVAEMPRDRAEQVSRMPHLVIEPDHPLTLEEAAVPFARDPGVVAPHAPGPTVTIAVTGKDQEPVEGAGVFVFGSSWPAQAVTDAGGQAQVTLLDDSVDSVRGLLVKPRAGYWSLWLADPALDPNRPNPVSLTPLDHSFPNFPNQEVVGWGLRAMRLDQLPANYRGHGVRVAVVDSGVATSHQQLQPVVKGGYDAVAQSPQGWDRDEYGHGSHAAGIIAAAADGKGIRGIAPEVELHSIRVFPGGRVSHLIDALNRCIELQVDLVNLGVGCEEYSELLELKLREAKELGVACIVAAGSSGGPVQYPASSPHVLTVAAIGRWGEFPADSYHATQAWDGPAESTEQYFSARFSCAGPEIDVCAPGVAVLSCVPPNDYAMRDGTSAAAPHVTGLAALVLAHHPELQGALRVRDAARVDRLFRLLRQSARPLNLDPNRTGAGLPDAVNALLRRHPEIQAVQPEELRRRLLAILEAGQSGTTDRATLVEQILVTVQQSSALPIAAVPQPRGDDPRFALKQLRGAMQQAGLLPRKGRGAGLASQQRARGAAAMGASAGPGAGRSSGEGGTTPGDGWPMRELTEVMRQTGLL